MGTRSLTVFQDEDAEDIAVMYRQFDGYPEGHGKDLAEILAPKRKEPFRLVNGFSEKDEGKAFNGMACLAASVVAGLKDGIGNIYLYRAGTRDAGEDYIYTVFPMEAGQIGVAVLNTYEEKEIFRGNVGAFRAWVGTFKD